MELPSEVLSGDLPSLVSAAGGPVFVGGVGAASHRDAIAAAGAVALGADIPTGVRRVLGALTETRTQR
jgi:hypothetical protein